MDDHPLVRMGASTALSEAPDCEIVGEADSAADAVARAIDLKPDLVFLDVKLQGGGSGIDVARELRSRLPGTKIIIFTNFSQEPYIRAIMEVGVDGYLLKDTPPGEVLDAVRTVMAGSSVYSSQVSSSLVSGYLGRNGRSEKTLTAREAELLQLVADGLTNEEIGAEMGIQSRAVQARLKRLYARLDARDGTEALVIAARKGLVVLTDE